VTLPRNLLAGMALSAAMARGIAPLSAFKTAAQSVASNASTFVADADLYLPMAVNTDYFYILSLIMEGAALGSGDLHGELTGPSGATVHGGLALITSTAGANTAGVYSGSAFSAGVNGTTPTGALAFGTVSCGGTAGNLQFSWHQLTSSSTATVVEPGSALIAVTI